MKEYDSEKQILKMKTIGGYGGAAALEALNIMSGNGTVTIELGVFDMEKFYAEPPQYILTGKYAVQYLVLEDDGNTKDFKTITTQPVEKVQLRLGFFDRLKRAKEFSLARLFDRNLI